MVGIRYAGEGKAVDPVRMAVAAVTIASLGTAGAVAGAAGAAAKAGAIGAQVGVEVGKQAVMGVASSLFLGRKSGTAVGIYPIQYTKEEHFLGLSYDFQYYHDYSAKDKMYGSLYFGKMSQQTHPSQVWPQVDYVDQNNSPVHSTAEFNRSTRPDGTGYSPYPSYEGVGGDYQQYVAPTDEGSYYASAHRPISIAHDAFSVMGEGVSGNIRPQRLDIGSLAYPRPGTAIHHQYNVVPFLNDYKVGFRYENSLSNAYTDLRYTPTGANNASGFDVVGTNPTAGTDILKFNDPRFLEATRTPADRYGLYGPDNSSTPTKRRRLVQGRHISWFSNQEIATMYQGGVGSAARTGQNYLEYPEFARPSMEPTTYWTWYSPSSNEMAQ